MSSFSSVVRKPGQKITPKAAPRRNVQRHAPKPARPVASTLTPESLPQSPSPQVAQPPSVVDDDASRRTTADEVRTLTPPTTIPDPASREDESGRTRITSRGPAYETGIASPDRQRESTVPVVATTDASPNTRQKRRAGLGNPSGGAQNTVTVPSPQRIDPASPATKRRKIAPPEAAPLAAPLSAPQPAQAPVAPRRTSNHRDDAPTPGADADLQVVSSRLRTVSELANSIETRARASRSRTGRRSTADTDSEYEEPESQSPRSRDRASKSAAIEDAAAAVVAKAVRGSKRGRARHRRGQTPEDAETHQIDATKTSMVDLVTDSGLGKRSETGKRLESEWIDIKQRWDQKLEHNRTKAKMKPAQRKAARTTERIPDPANEVSAAEQEAPQMIVIDGQITLAEESRQVDFSHNIEARANIIDESQIQTDERIYNYVNQNRIGKNAGLRSTTKWSGELTEKLYQGLRMFGTDFELITSLFGGNWTRRQIKAKFVREERLNLDKVKAALAEREQVDLSGYGSFIEGGIEGLRDPKEIEAELAAEEKKIRDEYEKSKRGDHFVEDEADQPLESIETDQAADGGGEGERPSATPGLEGNRYAGLADRIVRKATQPRKKQPQKHRENTGTSKTAGAGRRGTRGKKPLEGVEERIGNVHDVEL